MRRSLSLQARLLGLALGGVVLVWALAAGWTARESRRELDGLLDGHLAQAAALLIARQAGDLDEDDTGLDAPTLHPYAQQVAFQVWHEGELVLHSANAPAQPMGRLHEQRPADRHAARDRDARGGRGDRAAATHDAAQLDTVTLGDGLGWRVLAARGAERDVTVYVGEQLASREAILAGLQRGMLLPIVVALPVLALLLWAAVRGGLRPLRTAGEAIAQRDPRALQPIGAGGAPAEIAPLIDALDGLFGRIGSLLDSERRFTADAAHELRTPIAAIRTQAQVALGATDAADRRHALQATLEGCDRAARLVEQLLTLARLESSAGADLAPQALGRLAREVLADLAPAALARGQTLELQADDAAAVRGSEVLLRVLLRNLVDNALRYSPDGARIEVAVARDGGRVRLQVDDSGPGLGEASRARLGERFFREAGQAVAGSGLGWSIVRRIADVHAAEVITERSPLGGLGVRVRFAGA